MTELRSVVVERDIAYPPEKIWRALTQPHLIGEWLMNCDFRPEVGYDFKFSEDWGAIDCKVLEVEPHRTLSYTWSAFGLESTVTWTLSESGGGTHLRMEHAGFPLEQEQAYQGATMAWPNYFNRLEAVVGKLD